MNNSKSQYFSNREAAILILKEEGKPINYLKIIDIAIKKGLVPPADETRRTPEISFNRDMHRAVRLAEEKNEEPPFKLVGRGIFELNPNYHLSKITEPSIQKEETSSDKITRIVQQHNKKSKEKIRERILNLDPYAFEELIGLFFDSMKYDDVKVTKKSRDGGIDVIANLKFGVNEIKVVVQTKRYTKNKIVAETIRALLGAVTDYNAAQGVLVTTSDFTVGAKELAKKNKSLIVLINGDMLVDQLIENNIGIKKYKYGLIYIDENFFENISQTS